MTSSYLIKPWLIGALVGVMVGAALWSLNTTYGQTNPPAPEVCVTADMDKVEMEEAGVFELASYDEADTARILPVLQTFTQVPEDVQKVLTGATTARLVANMAMQTYLVTFYNGCRAGAVTMPLQVAIRLEELLRRVPADA